MFFVDKVFTVDLFSDIEEVKKDITKYYNYIKFDGIDFVSIYNGRVVYRPKIRELGQIFEIGRVIKDSNVDFIEYKVKNITTSRRKL